MPPASAEVAEPFLALKIGPFSCFCVCAEASAAGAFREFEDVEDVKEAEEAEDWDDDDSQVLGGALTPEEPAAEPLVSEVSEASASGLRMSGSWMLSRVDGDFDAFLTEIGVGFVSRKAAAALGYGVGYLTNDIVLTAKVFKVITSGPTGTFSSDLRLDGTEQESVDPVEGNPTLCKPWWEGSTVVLESRRADRSVWMPQVRRFLIGDEMCVEQTTASGLRVRRFFSRR